MGDLNIPTPAEVSKTFTAADQSLIDKITKNIIDILPAYVKNTSLKTEVNDVVNAKVIDKIKSIFAEKNWQIDFNFDGNYTKIIISELIVNGSMYDR